MKKCIPRTSDRIITVLAAVVCAVAAFFACRELLCGGQPPTVFFAMTLLFGGVAIHTIWRMIYMGNWGFFYDDEKIIFALSRKDYRDFRWDELQNAKTNIFYPSSPAAWYFYFQDEKKTKKIAVTPRLAGYNEFVDMLRKKGFLPKALVLLILIKMLLRIFSMRYLERILAKAARMGANKYS